MTTFTVHLIGEDHTYFTKDVEANTKDEVYTHLDALYPEAKVEGIYSPDDVREIERRRYLAAERAYENDYYYGDDYYD